MNFQLIKRRAFPGAASEVTFVVPVGMSEFAAALDRAAGIYCSGFLRPTGWIQVRRCIWSYLELSIRSPDLVGLDYVAK